MGRFLACCSKRMRKPDNHPRLRRSIRARENPDQLAALQIRVISIDSPGTKVGKIEGIRLANIVLSETKYMLD